jgi:hypothetical protein
MDLVETLEERVAAGARDQELLLALHEAHMAGGTPVDEALARVTDLLIEHSPKTEDGIAKIAAVMDALALEVEATAGEAVPTVDEDGIYVGRWSVHIPVAGKIAKTDRDADVLSGAVFFDPVSTSVVIVADRGDRLRVVQGTIDLDPELAASPDPWVKLAGASRRLIESANDDGKTKVSMFSVAAATSGLASALSKHGEDAILVDREVSVAPSEIWDELRKLGVGVRGRRGNCS